ncbi:MAG: NAD(P)H-dependent oxidoreductase subunit E [bacterium]|nr:NAD(P)H-dependent oxidoreductase subunit E [bacterium]
MVKLSVDAENKVAELLTKYPDKKSVVMPALYIAQEELGFINADAISWVSSKVGLAPVHVMEVASFYTMYYKKPVGKYHFQVCRTLSCALRGAGKITEFLESKFATSAHEVSKDGKWSHEEVECLGSCGTAPMCQINDVFFENLTPEKLDEIIKRIDKEQPDLRLSAKTDKLGEGMKDCSRSQVI